MNKIIIILCFLTLSCGARKRDKDKQLIENTKKIEAIEEYVKSTFSKFETEEKERSDAVKVKTLEEFELHPVDPSQETLFTDGKDTIKTKNAILKKTREDLTETESKESNKKEVSEEKSVESKKTEIDVIQSSKEESLNINTERSAFWGWIWPLGLIIILLLILFNRKWLFKKFKAMTKKLLLLIILTFMSCGSYWSVEYQAALCELKKANNKIEMLEKELDLTKREVKILKAFVNKGEELDKDTLMRIFDKLQKIKE